MRLKKSLIAMAWAAILLAWPISGPSLAQSPGGGGAAAGNDGGPDGFQEPSPNNKQNALAQREEILHLAIFPVRVVEELVFDLDPTKEKKTFEEGGIIGDGLGMRRITSTHTAGNLPPLRSLDDIVEALEIFRKKLQEANQNLGIFSPFDPAMQRIVGAQVALDRIVAKIKAKDSAQ